MVVSVFQLMRAGGAGFGLAVLLSVPLGGPAHAAATVPFTEALTFSVNPDASGIGNNNGTCCDYINIVNSSPPSLATVNYARSGTWGSVTGTASADLASGQLKMRAAASIGDGSASPYMQTNAIFGDGFRALTTTNQPFTWTASSHAQFSINLSGVLNSSQPLSSTFNPDAFVILSILNKDTLDPNQPLINGPTAQQYFFWNIGNPSTQIYYTDQHGNTQPLTPTAQYSTVPSTITADFNPGGDFDWVLLLGASGQIFGPGDSFDLDLSHTLTLGYSGPSGSVTTSSSGLFDNYGPTLADTSVPEPASLLLLLSGVVGMAGMRRRA